jgi:hypothetical protein
MPREVASLVKVSLETMPPSPSELFSVFTKPRISLSILSTAGIICFSRSNNPPTEVQIIKVSASKPIAISVDNSSLSENFNSTLLTRSFSLTTGKILLFQNSVKVCLSWRNCDLLEK